MRQPAVPLEPMSEAEFATYAAAALARYAADIASVTEHSIEESERLARDQFARLLPDGLRTAGHHFLHVLTEDGAHVGALWFAERRDDDPPRLYLYDIHLAPAARGQGLGTRLLRWLDDEARRLGLPAVGLAVVRHNTGAKRLYERVGFEVDVADARGQSMLKRLPPA